MIMDKPGSEYSRSLEYLLRSYGNFVLSLRDYLAIHSPALRLHTLLHMWNHPRGLYNLIRTLALHRAQPQPPATAAPAAPPAPTPAPACSPLPPAPLEVTNPRYQLESAGARVKVEEGEEGGARFTEEGECEGDGGSAGEESVSSSSEGSQSCRSYKRGPYKSYSQAEKEVAVRLLVEEELPITEISRQLRIPCKNIKRWSTQGISRRSGGGRRKSSPQMEEAIKKWIFVQFIPGEVVELDRIQEFALAICADKQFKASRGWVSKFVDRANLRNLYTFR